MKKTAEQVTQEALQTLQWKITLLSSVMIVILIAVVLFAGSLNEYNIKIAFIEGQLSTAISHSVEHEGDRPDVDKDESEENSEVVLDMNAPASNDTYVPILVYKIDYGAGKLLSLDTDVGRMSDETEDYITPQILTAGEGSYRASPSSLLIMKRSYPEGDVVAITDASSVDEYMRGVIGTFVSLAIAICIVFGVTFWFLSRRMTAPVNKMWQRQQRFIADASHELKTPVSVIMANADIIKNETEERDVRNRAGLIFEETEKMTQLISDMMYLLTDKALNAEKEDIDLSRTCHKLSMVFEAKAWEKQMFIDDEDVEDDIHVMMDPVGLERVISILLDNAIKYGDEKTGISIGLASNGKKVKLTVSDKGDVIDESELESIFDRFFRTDTARTRTSETSYGLGLAMAKDIVVANGGRIYAQSNRDRTVFTVEVPVHVHEQTKNN